MHRITLRRQFPVEENILEILQFRKSVFLIAWTPRSKSPMKVRTVQQTLKFESKSLEGVQTAQ